MISAYSFYEPFTFELRRNLKKACRNQGTKNKKKQPYQKLYLDQPAKKTDNINTPAYVMALEHAWMKERPLCLVPDSSRLVTDILSSKFEGALNYFAAPEPLFSIAIPKDTQFSGLHTPGLFVSITTEQQRQDYIADFKRAFDIKRSLIPPQSAYSILRINYKVSNKLVIETITCVTEFIPQQLKALKQTDETQYQILLFVVGFMIYMSAFEDVVEDSGFIHMRGDSAKLKISRKLVSNVNNGIDPRRSPRFHMRQLRAECFYTKTEYASMKRGSRWIPVKARLKTVKERSKLGHGS